MSYGHEDGHNYGVLVFDLCLACLLISLLLLGSAVEKVMVRS